MDAINVPNHHKKDELCFTRPKYRQGRRDTAVKVYTINQESMYVVIQGVPALNLESELRSLCEQYGKVEQCRLLHDYPKSENYTEVYLIKYQHMPSARFMKKKLDDKTFYGGCLHVFYGPEFESIHDTREKLVWRQKQIAFKSSNPSDYRFIRTKKINRQSNSGTDVKTNENFASSSASETYVWAGKEYIVGDVTSSTPVHAGREYSAGSINPSVPTCAGKAEIPHSTNQSRTGAVQSPFIPRQVFSAKKAPNNTSSPMYFGSTVKNASDHSKDLSYDNTVSSIRKRMLISAAPNVEVSIKQRKTHKPD